MAALDWMDLFPMPAGSNPKVVLPPKLWQVALNSLRIKVLFICKVLFSVLSVLT
jgi:hypothetical protein